MTLKNAIPKADIDEVNAFIDNLMETDIPNPDITFLGYTLDPAKGGGRRHTARRSGTAVSRTAASKCAFVPMANS